MWLQAFFSELKRINDFFKSKQNLLINDFIILQDKFRIKADYHAQEYAQDHAQDQAQEKSNTRRNSVEEVINEIEEVSDCNLESSIIEMADITMPENTQNHHKTTIKV